MLEAGDTGACAPSKHTRRRRGPYGKNLIIQAEPADRLPFVSASASGKGGRIFWAPRPTGDHSFDCSLGARYGEAVLPLLREHSSAGLLSRIVLDIAQHGNAERDKALLIGMFTVIGNEIKSPISTMLAELNEAWGSRSRPRPHLRLVPNLSAEGGETGEAS